MIFCAQTQAAYLKKFIPDQTTHNIDYSPTISWKEFIWPFIKRDNPFIDPGASLLSNYSLCLCRASYSVPVMNSFLIVTVSLFSYFLSFNASTKAPIFHMLFIISSSVLTIHGIWIFKWKWNWNGQFQITYFGTFRFWPQQPCERFVGKEEVVFKKISLQYVFVP